MRSERLVPCGVGLGVLLLYLALPSFYHNFDGVACAIAVELGDLQHLVHGNHLIYGLAGWLFRMLLASVGIKLSALWSLQVFDSALGAAGAGLFCSILRRQGFSARISAGCALGLALSYRYWFCSLEAQVYMLAAFFVLMTLREALEERPSPYRLALWHAVAMLGHSFHALLTPFVLFHLWRSHHDRRGVSSRYLITAAALVLAAYTAAAALWVRPATAHQLGLWLLGSAALGEGRTLIWPVPDSLLGCVSAWLDAALRVAGPWRLTGLALWGAGFWILLRARSEEMRLVLGAWVWLLCYAVPFVFWEPANLNYHMTDLIPLWLLAAAAARRLLARPHGGRIFAGFLALLASFSLFPGILPISRPESNRALQKALWLAKTTPEDAWILAEDADEVYIPYFAHRRTVNLRYYKGRRAALTERLWKCLEKGEPVYATARSADSERALPSFVGLKEEARRNGVVLYRIVSIAG